MRRDTGFRLLFVVFVAVVCCMPLAMGELSLRVVTDRADALYAVGETAEFVVSVEEDGKAVTAGEAAYTLSLDGWKTLDTGTVSLTGSAVRELSPLKPIC